MGYVDYETGETPEERRMRLLAEMGSPFLGTRPDADLSTSTIDSGGISGFAPQGFNPQPVPESIRGPSSLTGLGASPYMDPGQMRGGSGRDYVDPPLTNDLVQRGPSRLGPDPTNDLVQRGQTTGNPAEMLQPLDQAPRLGNYFSKPREPSAPEMDGVLFNGTRSMPGRDVLARETPSAAIPSGPIASPPGVNVTGANGQDRSNAPRPPDAPKTIAPVAPAAAAPATPPAPAAPGLAQPQAAAIADGLSRKPGSPAATNWLAENADLFIAIGAGLLSGRNMGEVIIHGLKAANDAKATNAKIKAQEEANIAENLKKSAHANILLKAYPGMTPGQAIAMAEDSDLVKRAQQQVFPDPKDTSDQGRAITTPEEKAAAGIRPDDPLNYWQMPGKRPEPIGSPPEAVERPLTDPAERAKWQIDPNDKRPYSIKGNEAPKVLGGAGQTINVNTGQDKLVEIAAKQFEGHIGAVDNARKTLEATAAMRDQLNAPGGVITGAAAGDRLALQKVASLFGVADPSAITNTESLKAAAGPLVLATVKSLGSGSGISNADREFAEKIAGGNISLDETSIRRLIDIQERAATASMARSQRVIQQLIQTNPNLVNLAPLITAPPPENRPPAASQSAPPAPAPGAPGAPKKRVRVDANFNPIP